MNAVVVGIVGYVGLQILIGVWVSRRIATETDYILAGRSLGVMLGGVSIFATWFGAEVIMGAAGAVYTEGLSGAQAEPFAYAAGILVMAALFAARLWRRGIQTFGDFFRARYSPGVEKLAVVLLIPGSVFWAAAQIRGFGQIVGSAAGLEVATAITIAALCVVIYSVLGGLLADVYTDFIQGIVIVTGLVLLVVVVLAQAGGLPTALEKVEPARLALFEQDWALLAFLERWAIPICGSVVAVELISRILACRSPEVARTAAAVGGGGYLLIALIPVTLGLIGPSLLPDLAEAEQLIPELAKALLPTLLYVIFVGALVSAILSTVDSTLIASGSMLSHNLLARINPINTEAGKLRLARLSVAALGAVAYILALRATRISELVEMASAFASAGIFVTLVFGLFTRIGGPASAVAAMIAGASVWLTGEMVLGWETPYIAGLAGATIAYVAAAALSPSPKSAWTDPEKT